MNFRRFLAPLLLIGVLGSPGAAFGELAEDSLPASSTWYFHADLQEMRSTDAGRKLYGWLEEEVFTDIRDDAGFDVGKEVDRITAFATDDSSTVVLIEGDVSQESQDKLLAIGAMSENLESREHDGKEYYFAEGKGHSEDGTTKFNLDDDFYMSFALKNKLLITTSEAQMQKLLSNKGKLAGAGASGSLFVLTAEQSFVQAGLDSEGFDADEGFDSNILRNTESVAVMVADVAGKIAIEAHLVAKQAEMAESLASIVRGLISLQVFNDEIDPDLTEILRTTTVDVKDTVLQISLALDPDKVLEALGEG